MNSEAIDVVDVPAARLQVGLIALERLLDRDGNAAGDGGYRTVPICELAAPLLRLPEVEHLISVGFLIVIGVADRLTGIAPFAVGEAHDPGPGGLVATGAEPDLGAVLNEYRPLRNRQPQPG